jgi:hypothetical protein
METQNKKVESENLTKAEAIFFEYMNLDNYPKRKIIINSIDVVQMIALGIEQGIEENESLSENLHKTQIIGERYDPKQWG